jgi:uncharacterized protein (DUF2062 family)
MPKSVLHRYLPKPTDVRKMSALKPLGAWLSNPEIWHLHRRSVAGATFVGLFCAFIPLPAQMLIAGVLAIAFRINLPVSIALVWITNPITIAPIFYFTYRLGAWLLGMELETSSIEPTFSWMTDNLAKIGYPLIFGSLVCGWVAGVTGFVLVRVAWRLHVLRRWSERRKKRKQRKHSSLA